MLRPPGPNANTILYTPQISTWTTPCELSQVLWKVYSRFEQCPNTIQHSLSLWMGFYGIMSVRHASEALVHWGTRLDGRSLIDSRHTPNSTVAWGQPSAVRRWRVLWSMYTAVVHTTGADASHQSHVLCLDLCAGRTPDERPDSVLQWWRVIYCNAWNSCRACVLSVYFLLSLLPLSLPFSPKYDHNI